MNRHRNYHAKYEESLDVNRLMFEYQFNHCRLKVSNELSILFLHLAFDQ